MNTRHIQNFLLLSAAFLALGGPVHAGGPQALAAAGIRVRQLAPAPAASVAQPVAAYLFDQAA